MSLFGRVVYADIGEAGNTGTRIQGVRIRFVVDKTATRSVNTADVFFYNLKESTRSAIQNVNNTIILMAGYEQNGDAQQLFRGDVDRFRRIMSPPDDICKIEAGDGLRALRETQVNISVGEGYSAQDALDQILEFLPDLDVAPYSLSADTDFANGFSYIGPAADALDQICRTLEASWSIHNGEIQIVERMGNNQTRAVHLSPSTGLLTSPEKIDSMGQELDGTKRPPGWRLNALLLPSIIPRGIVSVESEQITGELTVESVQHEGDTHGGNFRTIIEAFNPEETE